MNRQGRPVVSRRLFVCQSELNDYDDVDRNSHTDIGRNARLPLGTVPDGVGRFRLDPGSFSGYRVLIGVVAIDFNGNSATGLVDYLD